MRTLLEAANYVRENRDEGVTCPCCGQFAKLYRRSVNSTMARWLIELVQRFREEPRWYSVRESWSLEINGGTGDVAKLLYWGLIERKPNEDTKKRTSGLWRPTQKGVQFVKGNISIPERCYVYAGECEGFSETMTTIRECLGEKFDYMELMGR